jgi:hypothetical protein
MHHLIQPLHEWQQVQRAHGEQLVASEGSCRQPSHAACREVAPDQRGRRRAAAALQLHGRFIELKQIHQQRRLLRAVVAAAGTGAAAALMLLLLLLLLGRSMPAWPRPLLLAAARPEPRHLHQPGVWRGHRLGRASCNTKQHRVPSANDGAARRPETHSTAPHPASGASALAHHRGTTGRSRHQSQPASADTAPEACCARLGGRPTRLTAGRPHHAASCCCAEAGCPAESYAHSHTAAAQKSSADVNLTQGVVGVDHACRAEPCHPVLQ